MSHTKRPRLSRLRRTWRTAEFEKTPQPVVLPRFSLTFVTGAEKIGLLSTGLAQPADRDFKTLGPAPRTYPATLFLIPVTDCSRP